LRGALFLNAKFKNYQGDAKFPDKIKISHYKDSHSIRIFQKNQPPAFSENLSCNFEFPHG